MTSPVGGKPDPTQDKYNDVHSRGTSFGAELDEQSVRKLLLNEVENPWAEALRDFFDAGTAIINEIADAIGGVFTHDGQRSKPIYDAIIAQMGPVKTQVNTLGQHLQELSTEVTERIDNQEVILGETQGHIDDMSTILDEQSATLAQNQIDLDAARQETSTAITQSGEAVSLAKSYNKALTKRITTEFNKATSQATAAVDKASTVAQELADYKTQQQDAIDEAIGKAEQAVADLSTLTPKVTDAVDQASKASSDVSALTPKVTSASEDAAKASQDVAKAQEDINAEQKKFNTFQTQFNKDQIEWNDAVARSIATQDTVNDNFDKWTEGATTAIEANTTAIAALNAPDAGASLMPVNPLTNEPYYLSWAGTRDNISNLTAVPESVGVMQIATEKVRYNAASDDYVLSKLNKGTVYRWSVWVYSSVAGSDMRFFFQDPVRGVSAKRVTGDNPGVVSNSTYGIWLTNVPKGWSKQSGTIEFDDEADYIYMYAMEWNVNLLSVEQYFAGLDIYPDVPTQKSVDDAQNTAIRANTDAVKALGKKSLGASLVPYKTPSDQEVKDYTDGKLYYDPWADPEYFGAGYFVVNPMRGRVTCANPDQGTKGFKGSYVTVDSSINYRVKFHTYTASSGSMLYIGMYDQNGELAIAETPFSDRGKVAGYIVDGITLPGGLKEWSGVVKFKPGTTQVRLGTFYWNHPRGSLKTTQEFGGLEIVPDVPTQDDLNLSFNNNFSRIDDELGLIKSTDKSFRDDQKKWNKASTDATTSLNNFQDQQTEINDLIQEQLWAQLDMIEQLGIQQPRVFHRRTIEGDLEPAPDWTTWDSCRYHESPFILHLTRFDDSRKMYWVAKGKWEGKLKVTTNWTNGASDVMAYDIARDEANHMTYHKESTKLAKKARAYAEEGGAWGTDLRNSTFEIYPTHLGRTVGIRNTGTGWSVDESVMETGGPSLIRHRTSDVIRFTNSVVCNRQVFMTPPPPQGGYNIPVGTVISPRKFDRKNFKVGVTYIFTEKPFTTNTW